jgi:ribulose-phosphate 3-epimerase
MARIAPSILSADFAQLATDVAKVTPETDILHVDVMDAHFVPNLTIGPPVISSLRKHTDLYFDCHLMMQNPGEYLEAFKRAGANSCSVHFEVGHTRELIAQMRSLGLAVGLGINPATQFEEFEEFLPDIDMLLVMTVQPGFGGQKFMADVMPKLKQARETISKKQLQISIEVDGGIDQTTAPVAAANGADTFVAGSAIFAAADPLEAASQLRAAIDAIELTRS